MVLLERKEIHHHFPTAIFRHAIFYKSAVSLSGVCHFESVSCYKLWSLPVFNLVEIMFSMILFGLTGDSSTLI